MSKPTPRPTIPTLVETSTLAKFYQPGDAAVVIKLMGVGNTAPFYLADKVSRTFVLKWDSRAGGHIIRIPHSLWQADEARMAHDLMDQRRLPNAMIVTFELPEAAEGGGAASAPASELETTTSPSPRAAAKSALADQASADVGVAAVTSAPPAVVAGGRATAAAMADSSSSSSSSGAGASSHPSASLSNKKGATGPSDKARIVVGPGPGRRSVAPTSRKTGS